MDTFALERQFRDIGADAYFRVHPQSESRRFARRVSPQFELDIQSTRRSERYLISVREDLEPYFELTAVNVRPDIKHLLLLVKRHDQQTKEKFLCGHDERHWFAATVDPHVRDVIDAMESLKPELAIQSQRHAHVKPKNRNKRKNRGFTRQGEWFFLPMPNFVPPKQTVRLGKEPLARPGSKPHIVDELIRIGGQPVFVHRRSGELLTEASFFRRVQKMTHTERRLWRSMVREPQVYIRGRVRHPDHATLTFRFWHRVVMNQEAESHLFPRSLAFLD